MSEQLQDGKNSADCSVNVLIWQCTDLQSDSCAAEAKILKLFMSEEAGHDARCSLAAECGDLVLTSPVWKEAHSRPCSSALTPQE